MKRVRQAALLLAAFTVATLADGGATGGLARRRLQEESDLPGYNCKLEGHGYPGNDLTTVKGDWKVCVRACQKHKDCTYWSHLGDTCYLKWGNPKVKKNSNGWGRIGPKYCYESSNGYEPIHDDADCCRSNGAYEVGSVAHGKAQTPNDCLKACDDKKECRFFSHSVEFQNCVLCSKCDFTGVPGNGFYTSWQKFDQPTACEEKAFEAKVPFSPVNLGGTNDGSARNLEACIGECDSDVQCKPGLKCFQRTGFTPVPGCLGTGKEDWDYCYDPTGAIELSGPNDSSATNLQICSGECDSDAQCAHGLKCFQRDNGETIPGCTGQGGGPDWDYCYDPNSQLPVLLMPRAKLVDFLKGCEFAADGTTQDMCETRCTEEYNAPVGGCQRQCAYCTKFCKEFASEPTPKPTPAPTPGTVKCYDWNNERWKGTSCNDAPFFTECGCPSCEICPHDAWDPTYANYNEFKTGDFPIAIGKADELGFTGSAWTASAWVYRNGAVAKDHAIFGTDEKLHNQGLHLIKRKGKFYMGFYHNDCGDAGTSKVNAWQHVAFVYDNGAMEIYVDGHRVQRCTAKSRFTGTGTVYIGQWGGSAHFEGHIKQTKIWPRALLPDEITRQAKEKDLIPTPRPTEQPTTEPTEEPTPKPTPRPTAMPTTPSPTDVPTVDPTVDPTVEPTVDPTVEPTVDPTVEPTMDPTMAPTGTPTATPTAVPTSAPPTDAPTDLPTTPAPGCAVLTKKKKCNKTSGCIWDGECRAAACSHYTKGFLCKRAGCNWKKKTSVCVEAPAALACPDYTKGFLCKRAGCIWNKQANVCSDDSAPAGPTPAPACPDYTKGFLCKRAGCIWNKRTSACGGAPTNDTPTAIPTDLPTEMPTSEPTTEPIVFCNPRNWESEITGHLIDKFAFAAIDPCMNASHFFKRFPLMSFQEQLNMAMNPKELLDTVCPCMKYMDASFVKRTFSCNIGPLHIHDDLYKKC